MEYKNIKVLTREEFLAVLLKWQKEYNEHIYPISFMIERFTPYVREEDLRWFVDGLFDDVESGRFASFLKKKRRFGTYKRGGRILFYQDIELSVLLNKAVRNKKPGVFKYADERWPKEWIDLYNPSEDVANDVVEYYVYNFRYGPNDQGAVMFLFDLENCNEQLFNIVADEPLFIKGKDDKVYAFVTSISV